MSSFTSPLIVSPLSDGRTWRLLKPFTYHIGSKYSRRRIQVPRGFEMDFASVPRVFWFLPDWATYSKAPVIHDYLYNTKMFNGEWVTRKEADEIFYEAMLVDFRCHKAGRVIAFLEYWVVRLFGWRAWK